MFLEKNVPENERTAILERFDRLVQEKNILRLISCLKT
jgi:hypothetical protein